MHHIPALQALAALPAATLPNPLYLAQHCPHTYPLEFILSQADSTLTPSMFLLRSQRNFSPSSNSYLRTPHSQSPWITHIKNQWDSLKGFRKNIDDTQLFDTLANFGITPTSFIAGVIPVNAPQNASIAYPHFQDTALAIHKLIHAIHLRSLGTSYQALVSNFLETLQSAAVSAGFVVRSCLLTWDRHHTQREFSLCVATPQDPIGSTLTIRPGSDPNSPRLPLYIATSFNQALLIDPSARKKPELLNFLSILSHSGYAPLLVD